MQISSTESVLGDFSDTTFKFHNVNSRTYKKNDKYFIYTTGADNKLHSFEIKYTFGFSPLQQYLVETENGHIQALNIAWDSRPESQGGQRWMHLRAEEDMDPQHLFFWTRHFQNWNSRCAECHSTNVKTNYNSDDNSYRTTWSEINVACEACHGPASQHLDLARRGMLSDSRNGFSQSLPSPLTWQFETDNHIAKTMGARSDQAVNMCGRCHSLRTPIADHRNETEFHNAYRLQLIRDNFYFPDGQIREEVFVMGSFLQSKMYRAGVTCINCHDPHSGTLKIQGNGLCTQCHRPDFYDAETHHHHPEESTGAACVNCHMPARTYMQVDARRDHSFVIPRPDMAISPGVPNACENCHKEESIRDQNWTTNNINSWGAGRVAAPPHWGELKFRASLGDELVTQELVQAVNNDAHAAIIRASLLDALGQIPGRATIRTAIAQLKNSNPLIRRAAVQAITSLPIEHRWQILSPYLEDKYRSVRFTVAQALLEYYKYGSAKEQKVLRPLFTEYRESLKLSEDSPATQLRMANMESQLGDIAAATRAYEQALKIEPAFIPALLNYAEFLRNTGNGLKSGLLLKKAVKLAPDSGLSHYSLGLHLIRQKQYRDALSYLKAASQQADAISHFDYVYAVALQNQGELQTAIKVLVGSIERWPNNYEILLLLVYYLDESGNSKELLRYLSTLNKIAPDAAEVKVLNAKYR